MSQPRSRFVPAVRVVAISVCIAILCGMLYWVGWLARGLFLARMWLEFAGVCIGIGTALWIAQRDMVGPFRVPVLILLVMAFIAPFVKQILL